MEKEISSAKILSVEIKERLRILIGSETFFIETNWSDAFFNGNHIGVEELKELKKLKCSLRDHLFTKYLLRGKITDIQVDQQADLFKK